MTSRIASFRRIAIAAGATTTVVVFLVPRLPRWLPAARQPEIDKLARSAVSQRTRSAAGRLSGGFVYKPFLPLTRSGSAEVADPSLLPLMSAASEIGLHGTDAHARGLAFLLSGDYDDAIRTLEQAVHTDSANALVRSDLSVAYLARAEKRGFAPDLAAALDAAEGAWRLRHTAETAWNRALVISSLHLPNAETAWDDELRNEYDAGWRQEAERRRAESLAASESDEWHRIEPRLPQWAAASDSASIHDAVRRYPAATLVYFKEHILPEWARAQNGGNPEAAKRLRNLGRLVANELDANGEHLPLDTMTAIDDACRDVDRCSAIARTHARAAEGEGLVNRHEFRVASDVLGEAASRLQELRSPYAFVALAEQSASFVGENRFGEAASHAEALLDTAKQRHYRTLQGRLLWILGLAMLHAARPEESIDYYRAAKQVFIDARDTADVSMIELLLGDACQYAGDRDAALEHLFAALASMRSGGDFKQLDVALFATGDTLAERGWPDAADVILAEAARQAEVRKHFAVAAMAAMSRSAAAAHRSDLAAAGNQARMSEVYWRQITDAGQRSLIANMNYVGRLPDRRSAVDELTHAIRFFEGTGNRAWLPQLLRQRALVHEQQGDNGAAERDFRQAIDISEQVLDNAAPPTMRDGFTADVRDNFGDVIRLLTAKGATREALSYAERLRLIGHGSNRDRDVLGCIATLSPSTFAAVYGLDGSDLIVWLVKRDSTTVFRSHEAEAVRSAAASLRNEPSAEQRTVLYDLLVRRWIGYVARDADLVILPTPELSGVPFAALLDRNNRRSLIDDYSVAVAPDLASAGAVPVTVSRSDRILIVADPAYRGLPRLPGSLREARDIASHYERPTLLLQDDATAPNVLTRIGDASVFHFAGHAFVNDLAPELSSIVLAGSNGNDTRVYLRELGTQRLAIKLVVLSACETAKRSGRAATLTIAHAFADAGAQNVVAALWPVPDDTAAAFSIALHDALAKGEPIEHAVRSAQLRLKSESNGDATWAAFCLFKSKASRTGGSHS